MIAAKVDTTKVAVLVNLALVTLREENKNPVTLAENVPAKQDTKD